MVVLLGAAALRGYFKGIIAMAARVAGVVAGAVACRLLAHEVASWFGTETTDLIVANVLIFVVVYLGFVILGRMLHSLFRALRLTVVNRLCGAAFCMAEVAIVLSLLMNVWHMASPSTAPASATTDGLRGIVYNVAPALLGYLNKLT